MRRNMLDVRGLGSVQKSQSSPVLSLAEGKAAANFGRGAYTQYVSTQIVIATQPEDKRSAYYAETCCTKRSMLQV